MELQHGTVRPCYRPRATQIHGQQQRLKVYQEEQEHTLRLPQQLLLEAGKSHTPRVGKLELLELMLIRDMVVLNGLFQQQRGREEQLQVGNPVSCTATGFQEFRRGRKE